MKKNVIKNTSVFIWVIDMYYITSFVVCHYIHVHNAYTFTRKNHYSKNTIFALIFQFYYVYMYVCVGMFLFFQTFRCTCIIYITRKKKLRTVISALKKEYSRMHLYVYIFIYTYKWSSIFKKICAMRKHFTVRRHSWCGLLLEIISLLLACKCENNIFVFENFNCRLKIIRRNYLCIYLCTGS